jgi:cupin fold WbuC family metalloprotein
MLHHVSFRFLLVWVRTGAQRRARMFAWRARTRTADPDGMRANPVCENRRVSEGTFSRESIGRRRPSAAVAESSAMKLKTVTDTLLDELVLKAQASPRRRANFNLHPELDDPVQRFLNAVEPGTYVRPHRHVTPLPKWELFVALAGRIAILEFDDAGTVTERVEVAAAGPVRAVEIPSGAWHGLVVLEPGTVLFEFKQGPYAATSDKDFAAWAPGEGEPGCQAMRERFETARVGDRCA